MPRVSMIPDATATPEQRTEIDAQVAKNGRITNMKRTLLHSLPAYRAYMEWYTLRDELEPIIGARGVIVYSHAISTGTNCLICSTFFRRYLIDTGEDPDNLTFNAREQVLVDYGRQLATDAHGVTDELYGRLAAEFSEGEILMLTAFGGIMVATNILNNALRVPLDEYLYAYRDAKQLGDAK